CPVPSKFYVESGARAAKVGDLFATIAPRYDLINDLQSFGLHRWWKRRLLRLAAVRTGERALDVCCGTGDVTFALAQAGAEATGFDFSEPMLAVARRRTLASATLHRSSVPAPRFEQGDALHLPFADAAFDLVTISYGLRNLADFNRGLHELTRVLRPGGRLLVLDFGKPDLAAWRWLYFQYLRWFVPLFGRIFCGDADTHGYILDSLRKYPAQQGVDGRLRELGYTDTRVVNLLGGVMGINYGRRGSITARPGPE
ncbi:MAG TPA: ubiquinone/menaquinone biosynthesis methyltransferase, partial [Candidatus Limnocylindria bacterium]|nr:ubiquinone/menaquinone biosynthesis methyltransferase [Candidatus Limnocylindria bacterium]